MEVLTQLGTRSALFAIREMPTSIPLTGAWHYVPVFATAPVDTLGNLGILNFASLDVNFSSQTVNPAIGVSINNQNLTARGFRVPINANFGFNVTSSRI